MIKLSNISKIYKVGKSDFYALKNISLTVSKGEFISIRGASGSGKTTLLNIIGTLDDYEQGEYIFDNRDIQKLKDEKKASLRNQSIGFVLQDFALINNQTVIYNVMLPLLFSRLPFRKLKAKAMNALESVGLADQAKKKANQLSGGQRQRVAIARAIVNEPSLLLADEPTGQLDSKTSDQIMNLIINLNKKGITVIVVTHDPDVAALASRTITISDGTICE